MPLRIYNSLTKQKEEFKPLNPPEVRMYVCGPTVYDEPHIGHLRSAYVFDMMRRYMEYSGYKVNFVRNVTDVDDKIIEKARAEAPAPENLIRETQKVSEKYLKLYHEDLKTLGISEPTEEPRATTHIPEMIGLIQKLITKGVAYAIEGDVYYEVNSFQSYGKLSHQKKDTLLDGVRIDPNEKKKSPLDFALWKKSKEGEPSWDSPWSKGRPGWHVECSAMSMKYLGETFDIHGGGRDLIFPHHENEIAQSEAVTGKPFANYWVHHGLITVNEQKMSKSLKNFITLKNILDKYGDTGADDLKFFFLRTHYSMPLDYSDEKMNMAANDRIRFATFLQDYENFKGLAENGRSLTEYFSKESDKLFCSAMDDDFNTSNAITFLHAHVTTARNSKDENVYRAVAKKIKEFMSIFSLSLKQDTGIFGERAVLITQYMEARSQKDYVKADKIRDIFLEKYKFHLSVDKNGGIILREASRI